MTESLVRRIALGALALLFFLAGFISALWGAYLWLSALVAPVEAALILAGGCFVCCIALWLIAKAHRSAASSAAGEGLAFLSLGASEGEPDLRALEALCRTRPLLALGLAASIGFLRDRKSGR